MDNSDLFFLWSIADSYGDSTVPPAVMPQQFANSEFGDPNALEEMKYYLSGYSHKDCSWLKPEMMDCHELMNDFTIDCIISWVFGALKGQELPEEIAAKLRTNKDYIEYNHARAPTGHVHTHYSYRLRQRIDGG
ncbi:hypothetical protein niasHT_017579 [Heterodera trifolii]|uniref:Uncharacterized protein n=2 Tax=Heterodera trifolii TaxID=157864 RepID=A0ABD2LAJ0_9BILA